MTKVFNEHSVEYVERNFGQKEYAWHTREKLTGFLGAERVRMDVRSLDPGACSSPYPFHRNAEELFIVLSGEMALRRPEGLTVVRAGDIVTVAAFDVAGYPETGKGMLSKPRERFRRGEPMDDLEGGQGVADVWADLEPTE